MTLLEVVVVVKNLHGYDGIHYVPGGMQDGQRINKGFSSFKLLS